MGHKIQGILHWCTYIFCFNTLRQKLPFSISDRSLRGISLRSQVSVGKGLPPSVEQVSLTLSPDFCSARKSPWIWGGDGGSAMNKSSKGYFLRLIVLQTSKLVWERSLRNPMPPSFKLQNLWNCNLIPGFSFILSQLFFLLPPAFSRHKFPCFNTLRQFSICPPKL